MAKPKEPNEDYEYKGVRLSTLYQPKERLDAVFAYQNWRETDVLLQTYPKSGTHLCADIYHNILEAAGKTDKVRSEHRCGLEIVKLAERKKRALEPERAILADLDEIEGPRLLVSHLPLNLIPESIWNNQLKILHVMRNPKDVLVSLFYFLQRMGLLPEETPFNDFLGKFIDSSCLDGRQYFLSLRGWYEYRSRPNLLTLQYEKMIEDLPATVRQIAEFIGVSLTDNQIEIVAQKNKFETRLEEAEGVDKMVLRQGKKGGWKSVLTVAQNERFDEWIAEGMKGMEDVQILYE